MNELTEFIKKRVNEIGMVLGPTAKVTLVVRWPDEPGAGLILSSDTREGAAGLLLNPPPSVTVQ